MEGRERREGGQGGRGGKWESEGEDEEGVPLHTRQYCSELVRYDITV